MNCKGTRIIQSFALAAFLIVLNSIVAPAAHAIEPCCGITAIDQKTGVVSAKVNATGQEFEFKLSNPAQLRTLKVGQAIYANLRTRQVSLDGLHPAGQIVSISAPKAAPVDGIRTPGTVSKAAPVDGIRTSVAASATNAGTGHIISISAGTANVLVDGTRQQLQFGPRQQDIPYMEQNQKVWINQARLQASKAMTILYLPWPQALERKDDLGHSHYMDTSIVISSTGRIDGKTHTWSSEELRGFTGGVMIFLYSDNCNNLGGQLVCDTLYSSPKSHRYGVNGHSMGNSDRTDLWSETVPTTVLAQTRHIKIVQIESPEDRLDTFINQAAKVGDIAKTIVGIVGAVS